MLAKLARIALVAEEMGRHDDAMMVAAKLTEGAQVWLNGTATARMLYDFRCVETRFHSCSHTTTVQLIKLLCASKQRQCYDGSC